MFILGAIKGQYVRKLGKTYFFLFVVTLLVEGEEMTVSTSWPVCVVLRRY